MSIVDSQCNHCMHCREGRGCRAFPEMIPEEILGGNFDHRRPYPGDGGIRFEPRDAQEWESSILRQMMDGEIEGFEWLPVRHARRAAEVQEEAARAR